MDAFEKEYHLGMLDESAIQSSVNFLNAASGGVFKRKCLMEK